MKNLFIFALLLSSVCAFAQFPGDDTPAEPPKPPDQWGHTFTTTVELASGQSADLYALTPEGCREGWAKSDKPMLVNGMKTDFVSWARPAKVNVEALEATVITVWCK